MKASKHQWPILIVSGQFNELSDEGFRLDSLVKELKDVQLCSVIPSYTYHDAKEIIISRSDLGAIVIDWDLQNEFFVIVYNAIELIDEIRERNKNIPILLMTDRLATEDIPVDV